MGHKILQMIPLVLYGEAIQPPTPAWHPAVYTSLHLICILSQRISVGARVQFVNQWDCPKTLKCNFFPVENFKAAFPAFCNAPTHTYTYIWDPADKMLQLRLAATMPLGYNSLLSLLSPQWVRLPSQAESWGAEIKAVTGTGAVRNRTSSPARRQCCASPASQHVLVPRGTAVTQHSAFGPGLQSGMAA